MQSLRRDSHNRKDHQRYFHMHMTGDIVGEYLGSERGGSKPRSVFLKLYIYISYLAFELSNPKV